MGQGSSRARLIASAAVLGVVACSAGGGEFKGVSSGGEGAGDGSQAAGQGGAAPEGGVDAQAETGAQGGIGGGCATDSYAGERVPLDMFLLLDRSGSMGTVDQIGGGASRWAQVTAALGQFLNLPESEGLAVGLGIFPQPPSQPPPITCASASDCYPYDDACLPVYNKCPSNWPAATDISCVASDYATPAMPISPLPGAAAELVAAIVAAAPYGNTPLSPALSGTMSYAKPWALAHPQHATVVVLATDGAPTGCASNGVLNAAALEHAALEQAAIHTFVIGIGTEFTQLNELANGGGTDKAYMVDDSNVSAGFLAALNEIRGAVACAYELPAPEAGTADPNTVNVAFTDDGGDQQVIPKVQSGAECADGAGWYYDDPAIPSRIVLCPASCEHVQSTSGTVAVVIGCQSVVK